MPSLFDYFTNSSIINGVLVYLNTLQVYLSDTVKILREPDQLTAGVLDFDDFQLKLLKAFLGILFLNLLLLFASWKYYGKEIYDRFLKLFCQHAHRQIVQNTTCIEKCIKKWEMGQTTTKEIEELKASVSKLKLPIEHTPRI